MFRLLYLVVLGAGILWIAAAMPVLTDAMGYVDSMMENKAVVVLHEQQAGLFSGEAGRRTKIVLVAAAVIIVGCEVWNFVRWRLLHRP
ncbi:MAG: hypothetical protein DWQ37_17350 [Planctomycetota bacterium]|nr:MAG: hypothetical protein DWQ37_17350 [Planctomycetota bacterium]